MKKFTLALAILISQLSFAQTRYIDEVFSSVTVTQEILYATNISVLTGSPQSMDLTLDLYEPTGDTASSRPVVIYLHGGMYLPQGINQLCTGTNKDSSVVEICTRLAKRGYVAAAINYRLGWNPLASTEEDRRNLWVNALYRGVQDTRTCVRFFRKEQSQGNQYGIAPNKLILMGEYTGGDIVLAALTLDRPEEIFIDKFMDSNQLAMVDTSLSGNYDGTLNRPFCTANHVGYSSDVCMAVNLDGSIADTTWLESGDEPIVAFHVPGNPITPYNTGAVLVSGTANVVVEVSGSYDVLRRANRFGNNDIFVNANFTDPYTQAANVDNDGHEGLFPFLRPGAEHCPWEWWDAANCPYTQNGLASNPDMSKSKAYHYIDTIMAYACPRMVVGCATSIVTGQENYQLTKAIISPNPTFDRANVSINDGLIKHISIHDITGRRISNQAFNSVNCDVDVNALTAGTYFLHIETDKGELVEKLIVN